MKIIQVQHERLVERPVEEIEQELRNCKNEASKFLIKRHKEVPLEEPLLIVEMTQEDYQKVAFYLELDKRNGVKTDLVLPEYNVDK